MASDETALDELRARLEALQGAARAMADIPVATLPDGRLAVLEPLMFGVFRLYWGPPGSLVYDTDSGYDYDSLWAVLDSVDAWRAGGFDGEPQGWQRHIGTGRRRPGGDPAKESVRA